MTSIPGAGLADDSARALASELAGRLEIRELRDRLEVEATSYVGRVNVGELQVTIEPKIAPDELLVLFRYAYELDGLEEHDATTYALGEQLFQDLIVEQLWRVATRLTSLGLAKRYVLRDETLGAPRGRIDFAAMAGGPLTRAALPCRHHPRLADHLLNRVLRAGVQDGAWVAQSPRLRTDLARLGHRLSTEIGVVRLGTALLEKGERGLNRLTAAYAPALELIRLLHEGRHVSLDDDGNGGVPLPGFLFDMNRFFQALLGRFLREHLEEGSVQMEYGLRKLMSYAPGFNPRGRSAPTPRPDFVLFEGKRVAGIFDAKYRDLWNETLPEKWLYQLAVYAMSQPAHSAATMLYPAEDEVAKEARIEINDPVGGAALRSVVLRPVDLRRLAKLVQGTDRHGRIKMARELAKV